LHQAHTPSPTWSNGIIKEWIAAQGERFTVHGKTEIVPVKSSFPCTLPREPCAATLITPVLHHSGFSVSIHQFKHFSNIDVDRAELDTSTASDACRPVPVLVHVILQLVHKTLPDPLKLLVPGIVAGPVKGEEREHTGIPIPDPVPFFP
jgi:hypothetical protein